MMVEHECHWIEGSGLYVREIKEITSNTPLENLTP